MNLCHVFSTLCLLTLFCFETVAQLSINVYPDRGVVVGQEYQITYSPADQIPTDFILRRGPSNNLNTIGTIGTATGGTFTWKVPGDLPSGVDYALEIRRGSTNNFSGLFGVSIGSGVVSSSTNSPSSPSTSSVPLPSANTRIAQTSTIRDDNSRAPLQSSISISQSSLSISSTVSSTASGTSTSISGTTSGAGPGTSTPPPSPKGNSGLTAGQKVGIGVGASIAGLLLALVAFFLGMSVRRRSRQPHDFGSAIYGGKPELDSKNLNRYDIIAEMAEDQAVAELGGHASRRQSAPRELLVEPGPIEMSSTALSLQTNREIELVSVQSGDSLSAVGLDQEHMLGEKAEYDDPRLTQNPWAHDESSRRDKNSDIF